MNESFAAQVRGPSATLPRGYLWLIPVWCAAAAAALWIAVRQISGHKPPMWFVGSALCGILIGFCMLLGVLATARHFAFRADQSGVWLGVRTARKRPKMRRVQLWWPEVHQLTIRRRWYGAKLEIALGPAARIVHRRGLGRQVLLMAGMLLMPFGLGRGTPGLTSPRADPPRYVVPIYDFSAEELRSALAPLAPAAATIVVVQRRSLRPARLLPERA